MSAAAKDLVLRLLEHTAERRLGGGPRGLDDVMDHPFFQAVDAASLYCATPPPVLLPPSLLPPPNGPGAFTAHTHPKNLTVSSPDRPSRWVACRRLWRS